MKFFSKNANLMVVLRQGLPGNAQLGTTTTPGLYVRFKDGAADLIDEMMIGLMIKHPGFNSDFIKVEEAMADPYAVARKSSEPIHRISEMDHGQPKRVTQDPVVISPELRASLMAMAQEMAKPMAIELTKAMLPGAVEQVIKSMSERADSPVKSKAKSEDVTDQVPAPRKGGRPKKVVEEVI